MIKTGQHINFSCEEEADYQVYCTAIALRDFDVDTVASEWSDKHTFLKKLLLSDRYGKEIKKGSVGFFNWLVAEEYIEQIDTVEIHTGSYSKLEITVIE